MDKFQEYLILKGKSEKTIKNYVGAFTFINNIAKENELLTVDQWNINNTEDTINRIKQIPKFIEQNTIGNNMYSASLNNFMKFMEETLKPQIPFKTFGWKWATTGIASHLNKPKALKVVLDSLLINGNGQDNYTIEFKQLIKRLCENKYRIADSDKLSKLSNTNASKNIIENSANYWYHLKLIESTGKNAKVSDLGERFLSGELSNDDFILLTIKNYSLPHKAYKTKEIKEWEDNSLTIHPFKVLQDILVELNNSHVRDQRYITEAELVNIVIPCSADIKSFSTREIVKLLIRYRTNPNDFDNWPDPQNQYTDDKGYRMANEFLYFLEVFDFLNSNLPDKIRSTDKKYFLSNRYIQILTSKEGVLSEKQVVSQLDKFDISLFSKALKYSGLIFSDDIITRFISSLVTKPFVLLSGLSGSGKTKLAQSFAEWISEDKSQYCIVPVGADWSNREPLLGYVNALDNKEYILPENGALELIIEANKKENKEKPYFLILDEMNLSHVERYFADFLSVMESNDKFKLHRFENNLNITDGDRFQKSEEVPNTLKWPKNLFVIGTVNIDETTYMFSPKVLDRANVIEFRIGKKDIDKFLNERKEVNKSKVLCGEGSGMGKKLVSIAKNKSLTNTEEINGALGKFFIELQKVGAEFGYRTVSEIQILFSQMDIINPQYINETNKKIDNAIMQKLLPKLHGSRRKLEPVLVALGKICAGDKVVEDFFENKDERDYSKAKYELSLEKITRMYDNLINNGFASYAEA